MDRTLANLTKAVARLRGIGQIALLAAVALAASQFSTPQASSPPFGLTARPISMPYLHLPNSANGKFPPLLSQTGAFEDVRTLRPSSKLIPYELIVPFWSDGASKSRWISIPKGTIKFSPTGEWKFPNGTVFVKEFDLATDETHPSEKRRLETRFLVRDRDGGVYGVTYRWRADNSDADLLTTSLSEDIAIKTASGTRSQTWYFPSRDDCLTCHTVPAGGVLGVKTRQLNREMTYPSGIADNELRAWNHVGIFDRKLSASELARLPKLASANDHTRTLEDRARSFLDANCSNCHRPGGTIAAFDARFETPLEKQLLINEPVLIDEGIDKARIIAPNDPWRSILLMRFDTTDTFKMPPLARMTIDEVSVQMLRDWIHSMPGPPVLDPPVFSPPGGNIEKAAKVSLTESEAGATIHYTLDGSVPTADDPVYTTPIELTQSTVVRARAFKKGFTRSIAVQQIYILGG